MRYLFNAVTDPRRATRILPYLLKLGRIEKNPGDMAYERAVMNTLATDPGVQFLLTGYYYRRNGFPVRMSDEANGTCKAFVCPLADAFHPDWIWFVRALTDLVRRLKIPCVVPCVGARTESGIENEALNEAVRSFVSAVLDKSDCLGVRGETTARYLETLGFVRGRHFDVLGCPSLYTFGEKLDVRPFAGFGKCAFTMNHRADPAGWSFIDRCASLFARSTYVSQNDTEFYHFMLSRGRWFTERGALRDRYLERYAAEGRMRYFLNHRPWLDFLSEMDFTVGHRIHGALLSILAGTPAAVVPFESRTEELARFHGIPTMTPEANGDRPDVRRLFDSLDFAETGRRQAANFANWASFLRENGLDTVFAHAGASIPDRNGFPLERNLPDAYPDDNLRAWSFNPPAARLRIGIAMVPEMAAGPILRNARRLKRIIGGRREKPN